jgi:Zn-dependent protease with chaperone function
MVKKFPFGLSSEHFAHPLDRAGIQRLMDRIAKLEISKNLFEKLQAEAEEEFYLLYLADNTKLSELQGSSVYRLVQEIAEIFHIPVPNVFLDTTPEVNAYALGGANPSIVLTSALVDIFPEPALRAVIAHELGHIICSHTFYRR